MDWRLESVAESVDVLMLEYKAVDRSFTACVCEESWEKGE